MLSLKELRQNNSSLDKSSLIKEFIHQLEMEWDRSQALLKDDEFQFNVEYKFRILYLYDEIVELIQDKGTNINSSFYKLYIKRLKSSGYTHESAYYNFKDILNLLSDILNKLEKSEDNSLAKRHNFSNNDEIVRKSNLVEFVLC